MLDKSHLKHKSALKNQLGTEKGFSLITVLLMLGVISFMFLVFSQSRVNVSKNSKNLIVKGSYRDVNQALIHSLSAFVQPQISATAPCLNLSSIQTNINNFMIVNKASPSYIYSNQIVVDPLAPPTHVAASARCRRPRLPSMGNQAADNRFYFCIRMGRDASAPLDSLLSAELAFAEIAVELVDLQNQSGISCADYRTRSLNPRDGSAGIAATTIFYWQQKREAGSLFSQKSLSYIFTEKK